MFKFKFTDVFWWVLLGVVREEQSYITAVDCSSLQTCRRCPLEKWDQPYPHQLFFRILFLGGHKRVFLTVIVIVKKTCKVYLKYELCREHDMWNNNLQSGRKLILNLLLNQLFVETGSSLAHVPRQIFSCSEFFPCWSKTNKSSLWWVLFVPVFVLL